MANITTGTISTKPLRKNEHDKTEDMENEDKNFQADNYNSGLIFGSPSELKAFRINKNESRRLEENWRSLNDEKVQCLRIFERKECLVKKQHEKLRELADSSYTYLEPNEYNRFEFLYNIGQLKLPSQSSMSGPVRPQSSKLIAEKARLLKLKSSEYGTNTTTTTTLKKKLGSRSISARNSRQSIFRISNMDDDDSNNISNDELIIQSDQNTSIRVISVGGYQRSKTLKLQKHIPHALTIYHTPHISSSAQNISIPSSQQQLQQNTSTQSSQQQQNTSTQSSQQQQNTSTPSSQQQQQNTSTSSQQQEQQNTSTQSSQQQSKTSPFVTNIQLYKHDYKLNVPIKSQIDSTRKLSLEKLSKEMSTPNLLGYYGGSITNSTSFTTNNNRINLNRRQKCLSAQITRKQSTTNVRRIGSSKTYLSTQNQMNTKINQFINSLNTM